MSEQLPPPVLDWRHAPADISPRGLELERKASTEECRSLARALDILEVRSLVVRYGLAAHGRSRDTGRGAKISGELEAEVVQACVVTLEPVPQTVREPIAVELRDAAAIDPTADIDPEEEADLEPLDPDGSIPLGRIVYEVLAAGLDPFPRAPEATVTWSDPATRANPPSAFAALDRLRAPGKGKADGDGG